MVLRVYWCDTVVLNAYAQVEDTSDDSKSRFYEELEQVFHQFCQCHMKILLFQRQIRQRSYFQADNTELQFT